MSGAVVPDARERVIWHDIECGGYDADLPLWRTLADVCGGPVLDVGAGTGRVALDLAAHGHEVTALDVDGALLEALQGRADSAGLTVRRLVADVRDLDAAPEFALVIVPMQTLQLLDDRHERRRSLRAIGRALLPGGLLAAAIADTIEPFDGSDGLPSADVRVVGGVRYSSQPLAVTDEGDHTVLRRRRTIGESAGACEDTVRLARLSPAELQSEMSASGLRPRPSRVVASTSEHVGSTVVIAGG